ncbi:MAG: FABP family protein [Actinomycetota bacterium]|nr:FABP family protein [Actinomycetota bacterium]
MSDSPAGIPVHPDAAPLQFLLGTWRGAGHGGYSTVSPFDYQEEVRFWHVGKPFLAYSQRTWAPDDGRPMHVEFGFWRPKPAGAVEVVVSHPTGHVEIQEGSVDRSPAEGHVVELTSRLVQGASSALQVDHLTRRVVVRGDVLSYTLGMAAVSQPLQTHLSGELRRA